MVRSLLGDLIARTKEEAGVKPSLHPPPPVVPPTHPHQRIIGRANQNSSKNDNHTTTTTNNDDYDDIRKPSAKRKRRVNFDTDHDADDDSLYRDDDRDIGTEQDETEKNALDNTDTESRIQHQQEDYYTAFSVIYRPPTAHIATSASADDLMTLQEVMVPNSIVPPVLQYSTPAERKQPRFLRKRNHKSKTWETVQETPEQAADRFHRQERSNERLTIEARWKGRPFDLRQEEDIGGAIYKRAKRLLKEKVQREIQEKRRKEQAEASQKAQEVAAAMADKDDEGSVQEQQDVLDRLTQNSMDATGTTSRTTAGGSRTSLRTSVGHTSGEDTEDVWTNGDATVSYRDRMDYWEYGLTVPRDQDLEFRYNIPDLTPQLKSGDVLRDPDSQARGLRLSMRYLGYTQTKRTETKHEWVPAYFPNTRPQRCSRFFHYRSLQTLAARHLCGGSLGENPKREDRFLRLLFSPLLHEQRLTLAQFSYARALLRLSHQLGSNALLYATNIWSNPMEVARELCLLPQSTLEAHVLAGRTLNPNFIKDYMKERRLRVMKKFRIKSRPWNHTKKELEPTIDESTGERVSSETELNIALEKKTCNDGTENLVESARHEVASEGAKGDGYSAGQARTRANLDVTQGTVPLDDADAIPKTSHHNRGSIDGSVGAGTSAGGVIIDLQTRESKSGNKDSTLDAFSHGPPADAETSIVPSTTFSHIPGTPPPVPQFPVDAVSIVYGPVDRHAKYHHQDNFVHHNHFQLALSTLLSRAVMAEGGQGIDEVQQRIQTMLEQYVNISDTKGHRRQFLYTRGKARDIPSVQLYRAIQSHCSFWANGFPRRRGATSLVTKEEDTIKREFDQNDTGDDLYANDEQCPILLRDVAEEIYVFLDNCIQHNGLVRFARLRVIYALAFVCHKLPIGAAKIVAKPLDDHHPTPIHVLRHACEYLESNNLIRGAKDNESTGVSDEEAMRDGELEYVFFEAAGKLEVAVRAAPIDIDCHLWRIGMLAACLLLSSGNRIGSGAHRYPSRATRRAYETVDPDPDHLEHEIRVRLPKYEEIAAQLSSAINALLSLARHQPGEYIHRAVASFLEWSQVVALLAGALLEHSIDDITSIHAYHTVQRYLGDDSESARKSVTASSKTVPFFASELERDPSDIKRWRNLVDAVGPIGIESNGASSEHDSHASSCLHCQFTRLPRIFDHERREKSGLRWWGQNREWWLGSLLKIESTSSRNGPLVGEAVRSLKASDPSTLQDAPEPTLSSPAMPNDRAYSHWLPTRERLRRQRCKIPSREECMASFDHGLPVSACDPIGLVGADDCTKQSISSLLHVKSTKVEVMCYKIFLSCHLLGPGDRMLEKSVSELLLRGRVDSEVAEQSSDEWQALEWLYCVAGLDIPKLAKYYYGEGLNKPVKKPCRTRVAPRKKQKA